MEENWSKVQELDGYAKYIATRPRAERLGEHGLFGDEDVVDLNAAMAEVNSCTGNIWTHIISLRREDAERLGFDHADAWRALLRAHRNDIAEAMHIPPEDFRWYAAFHDEGGHPHVHMMAWSKKPGQAYLNREGIRKIKSALTNQIFQQELLHIYEDKSQSRDELVRETRSAMLALAQKMQNSACEHPEAEQMIWELARELGSVKGKKSYGYLPKELKQKVDAIVDQMELLPSVKVRSHPVRRAPRLAAFLESQGYGEVRYDVTTEPSQGRVAFHKVEANGTPVMATGLVESSQQEIDEVVRIITERAASFNVVPVGYTLTVVTLTDAFRSRLGAELKSLASKNKTMGQFLRHVRIVALPEIAGAQSTDVILSLCYAKTVHGRLLQQFGVLEGEGGRAMLLDALALCDRHLDIVSAFDESDLDDERLHQPGPQLLHAMLRWVEQLDDHVVRPVTITRSNNVLFNDLAERVRSRGLNAAVDYGFDRGLHIPMVVGLPDKPFALAVLTDDAQFMSVQSTRERHRGLMQDLASLGWSVMSVWSVGAFVNPDKEVDAIVSRIGEIYGDVR